MWLWTQSPTWMAWAAWASAMRSGSSPTVGCVNSVAEPLAREASHDIRCSVTGVYAWPHPYGCSQTGDDQEHTRQILCDLIRHPNAGGVLVLGRDSGKTFYPLPFHSMPPAANGRQGHAACQKGLAEFAARRRQRSKIIFSRDICVRENTSQAASVEFARLWHTNYAHSRLQPFVGKPGGFFRQSP